MAAIQNYAFLAWFADFFLKYKQKIFFFLGKFLKHISFPKTESHWKKHIKTIGWKTKVNITKEYNLSYIHMGPKQSTYLEK